MDPRLILAAILFLTTAALARKDIRWPFYLLVLALPLDNRIVFTLGIDRLLPVRVILLALITVSYKRIIRGLRDIREDKIGLVLLVLWLVRAVSLVRTQNLWASLGLLAFYSVVVGFYFVFKSVLSERGREFVLKILRLYLLVGVATGFVSIIQYIFYKFFGIVLPAVWPTEYQPVRIGSTFWDINHYGAYLLTIIPPLMAWALCRRRVCWAGVAFGLLVLGMTLSRSSWIAFAFSAFLMLALLLFKRHFAEAKNLSAFLGLAAVVILLGVVFFDLPVADRLYTFFDIQNNDAIQAHILILKGGFEVFKKFPILGGGYGGFNEHFRQTSVAAAYLKKDPVGEVRLPAHSIWMETLSETGIVGFGLYLTLMVLVLKAIWGAILRAESRFLGVLSIATFSSLVGLLLSGVFYSYNLEFFWFFIFLSALIAQTSG